MTQAYNLAILANAVDTSGRLNVGTNATGTLPVANGGTGTSTPSLVAGSGITITGSFPNQTIASSGGSGTVTSVATGNGLQGGTITTSGTLSVACPTFNTVGSYVFGGAFSTDNAAFTLTSGTNYAAGGGQRQMHSASMYQDESTATAVVGGYVNNLSGTWKYMSGTKTTAANFTYMFITGLLCRVS